ncbi:AAA family ATPase [Streptomyces sp. NBC_01497]|uniref:AAA family ATPase n=1 Tax=Streptomyces sp. NBC_01497 TaxID=2903885 RepID=UPI002E323FDE|nr:AAA family ATPase [Streptomyces sp. NBC_01497]
MGERVRPHGVVDLRGGYVPGSDRAGAGTGDGAGAGNEAASGHATGGGGVLSGAGGFALRYPPGAVVVVSGLPGSGKSTLLRALSQGGGGVLVVDPRVTHLRWEAMMPARLPYAVYRPFARLAHLARLYAAVRSGAPLLVHDCGSRAWLRRLLAVAVRRRRGRAAAGGARSAGVHLVLLDVPPAHALRGQRDRGRRVPRRVFAGHVRGLGDLVAAIGAYGLRAVPQVASVVLLDRATRGLPTGVAFDAGPSCSAGTGEDAAAGTPGGSGGCGGAAGRDGDAGPGAAHSA